MPGPSTQEEAFSAIVSLLKKGRFTTQRNLRQELGGRGSGPKLNGFMDAFYARYGRAMATYSRTASEGDEISRSPRPDDSSEQMLVQATTPADSPWRRLIDHLSAWEEDLQRREEILSRREIDLQRQLDR